MGYETMNFGKLASKQAAYKLPEQSGNALPNFPWLFIYLQNYSFNVRFKKNITKCTRYNIIKLIEHVLTVQK